MLEPLDTVEQDRDVDTGGLVGELHQRHLEQETRVRGVTHLDEHLAETLHGAHDGGRSETGGEGRHLGGALHRKLHQFRRHQRQEAVAQVADDVVGEGARIATLLRRMGHHGEGPTWVVLDEILDELVEGNRFEGDAPAGRHQFERRHRVARRASTLA